MEIVILEKDGECLGRHISIAYAQRVLNLGNTFKTYVYSGRIKTIVFNGVRFVSHRSAVAFQRRNSLPPAPMDGKGYGEWLGAVDIPQ